MLDLCEAKCDYDEGIPAGLDEMEPGPILATFLSGIDVNRVSGYARIIVLRAHQRLVSHYTASLYADTAAVVDILDDDETKRSDAAEAAAAEVRAALHLTRRSADNEIGIALELHTRDSPRSTTCSPRVCWTCAGPASCWTAPPTSTTT